MITQQRLHELFIYEDGHLIRRVSVKGSPVGTVIGTIRPRGYMVAVIDRKSYRVHHLVWMYHYGQFVEELDHRNRVRNDNRIENLRPCTHSQNLGNTVARVHKYKGVTFCKNTNKWRAQLAGHIGRFNTIEEAARAYNVAAIKRFGEFALLNNV
jgi:hypothetical protein